MYNYFSGSKIELFKIRSKHNYSYIIIFQKKLHSKMNVQLFVEIFIFQWKLNTSRIEEALHL